MLLLNASDVTLTLCSVLNPASLLPPAADGEPYYCLTVSTELSTPRINLKDTPLYNPDLLVYVDGSCLRNSAGQLVAGYAVCSQHEPVESHSLPGRHSAQVVELVSLAHTCTLAKDKSVTIYTDSRYAFGVVHDYGQLWKHCGFLTSGG
ncbi:unnamed protein product [Caretta caretta]